MKVLLTGATGFVGLNLLLRLLPREDVTRIGVSVRHGGKLHSLLAREGMCGVPEKIEVVSGDSRRWGVAALSFKPDVCIHCAGVLFARHREEYFAGNEAGTRNLLRELPESTRVLVLSSQSAAGPTPPEMEALGEEDESRPLSFYGQSKLAMERMLVAEFSGTRDMVILRPPMVLGPRDTATVPLFRMVRGPIWCKPGTQDKTLSWIAVADLVDAIMLVIDFPGTIANGAPDPAGRLFYVAAANTISDRELIRTAAEVVGRRGLLLPLPKIFLKGVAGLSAALPAIGKSVPSLMPDRARELWQDRWVISGSRFACEFSWASRQSLREALDGQFRYLQSAGFFD